MKKRVLMILLIVVSILLIPRNTGNNSEGNNSKSHLQHKKVPEEPDELDVPFLGIWSVAILPVKAAAGRKDIKHIPANTLATNVHITNLSTGLWV